MLRWKSVFLGVLISWTYMAFADHGASHGAPHHSAPVHHEPAPSYSEPHYARKCLPRNSDVHSITVAGKLTACPAPAASCSESCVTEGSRPTRPSGLLEGN